VRLVRRFGSVRLARAEESVWLSLDRVPGLARILLNGTLLEHPADPAGALEVLLPPLLGRNELVLEVNVPAGVPGNEQSGGDWGDIALLIRGERT
jgi:hypothetical protein